MECSKSQWRACRDGKVRARTSGTSKPSETAASWCVLFPSTAMDLARHVAAWLRMTAVCQEWLCADALLSWCEQQSGTAQAYL